MRKIINIQTAIWQAHVARKLNFFFYDFASLVKERRFYSLAQYFKREGQSWGAGQWLIFWARCLNGRLYQIGESPGPFSMNVRTLL